MTTPVDAAVSLAAKNRDRSVKMLADFVRIRSLTGEEGDAQSFLAEVLRKSGATVDVDHNATAGVVCRRHHRYWFAGHVEAKCQASLVHVREVVSDKIGRTV